MSRPEDLIRSFGMSGLLITEEIRDIEKKLNLEFGHTLKNTGESTTDYYPQFEQSVRAEASEMASHYEVFYCLEISIRKLITEALQESKGIDWWDSGLIPQDILKAVSDRIQREAESGVTTRSEYPIDYTTFGELSVIITSNWGLFGAVFTNRRAVEKVMSSLNLLRGPIAHCCPLAEDEIDRLRLAVKDWFRIIG